MRIPLRVSLVGALAGIAALIVAACGGSDATATPAPTAAAPTATRPAATPTPPAAAPTATQPPAPTAATATPVPSGPAPTATATATPRPVPTPTPTPIPPTPTPVKELPKRGGTVRKYSPTDPPTLEISKIEHFAIWFSIDEAFSNLVQYRSDSYNQVEFSGDLADRWEVNSGGDVYTFFLNPNARWQNLPPLNGRPVTAADVKWTFELLMNPDYGSQMRSRVNVIKEITAVDDKTVQLKLVEPTNNILYDLAWVSTKIEAKEMFDQKLAGKEEGGVIGSGPFTFNRWEKGSVIRMRRSTNYWRNGVDAQALPYLDGYETVTIVDPQTHVAAMRAGQLDYGGITGFVSNQVGPLRNVPGLELFESHPGFIATLGFQHQAPPLNNLKLRQALMKAFDPYPLMRNGTQAPDAPLESFVYSTAGDMAYGQDKLKKLLSRDIEGAKKLFAESGVASGTALELLVVFNRSPYPEGSAILKQQWEELGLKINIFTGPDSETTGRQMANKFQLMISPLNLQADPIAQLRTQWRTEAGRNWYKYSNPAVDKLMDQAKAEFDRVKLKQILDQTQDLMWADVAGVPISPGVGFQAQWNRLKGFKNNFAWGDQGLKYAWLDR